MIATDVMEDAEVHEAVWHHCRPILEHHADDATARIVLHPHNPVFVLAWNDLVANSWAEQFDTLSAATARLADLVYCLEHNCEPQLRPLPDGFVREFQVDDPMAKEESSGADRIRSVVFDNDMGRVTVVATLGSGEEIELFTYFVDELSFARDELVGLTVTEARTLCHRKDVSYLQS